MKHESLPWRFDFGPKAACESSDRRSRVMPPVQVGFVCTQNKGFQVRFNNGWGISVQFGPTNYTSIPDGSLNRSLDLDAPRKADRWQSPDAEIAVSRLDGEFLRIGVNDDVVGWVSPERAAAVIATVSMFPDGIDNGRACELVQMALGRK